MQQFWSEYKVGFLISISDFSYYKKTKFLLDLYRICNKCSLQLVALQSAKPSSREHVGDIIQTAAEEGHIIWEYLERIENKLRIGGPLPPVFPTDVLCAHPPCEEG
jgi:hypothetical protein